VSSGTGATCYVRGPRPEYQPDRWENGQGCHSRGGDLRLVAAFSFSALKNVEGRGVLKIVLVCGTKVLCKRPLARVVRFICLPSAYADELTRLANTPDSLPRAYVLQMVLCLIMSLVFPIIYKVHVYGL
jgi:hypothetical protein